MDVNLSGVGDCCCVCVFRQVFDLKRKSLRLRRDEVLHKEEQLEESLINFDKFLQVRRESSSSNPTSAPSLFLSLSVSLSLSLSVSLCVSVSLSLSVSLSVSVCLSLS